MPDIVTLRDSDGRSYGVPQEQVASYLAQGFRPESDDEHGERLGSEVQHELYGGPLGTAGAIGAGALSGLTLGASDLGIAALGGGGALRGFAAEHPYATGAGTIAGAIAPTILTGGAAAGEEAAGLGARILAHTPAGLAGRAGGAIGELGEGAGLVGRTIAGTAGAAAEGALYGGGQYLTETALEDKPMSAEGFVASMGHGALFAAPIGAAGTLASATLQRARALFPRSEVSAAAAAGVKEQASSALAQTVRDGDAMVQAAERRLSDIDAGVGMAQAGETTTRRAFGGADPQALADQVTGATARQEVGQALDGYRQARGQFEDWIAHEADPEFAAAMGKIEGHQPALDRMLAGADQGDLETLLGKVGGGAPGDERLASAMRATLAEPDLVGAGGVPVREFGAPGARGIKTPDELQRIAEGSAGDGIAPAVASADATGAGGPRALRSQGTPAGGVPAQDIVQQGMAEQPATAVGKRPAVAEPREISTDGEFRGMQQDLRAKLTPDEIKQSIRFSREHYMDVNRALRGNRAPLDPEAAKEITPVLDRVLDKSVIDHPIVTHRGFPNSQGYDLAPGSVLYDPGFGSTSWTGEKINRFGKVHLVITSPAGTHIGAIPSSAAEGELTLARGTSMRVTGRVEHPDGGVTVHATVFKQDAYGPVGEASTPAASDRMRADLTERARVVGRYSKGSAPLPEGEVPEHGALSKYLDRTGKDYADQTLPARAIGERGYFEPPGGGTDAVRVENARKAIADGQQTPVKLTVSPEGKILVTDGRHPLAAAIEADAPIKVRWSTGTEPAAEDAFRAGAKATAPAGDDLLAALSGTKAALGRGESFTGVGRAPAMEARAVQRGRAAEAALHFRAQALEARTAAEPEVGDATMGRILAKHGLEMAEHAATSAPEVGDVTMRRILAEHGLGDPAPAREPMVLTSRVHSPPGSGYSIERGGYSLGPESGAAEPDTLAARILRNESRPGAIATTGPVSDVAVAGEGKLAAPMTKAEIAEQRARFRAVAPEQRTAKAIMRHNGRDVDMGPSLARGAKAIGDMEQASARLADALGSEAPPTAVTNAKAFHAATGHAQERAAASSAKLGADLQHKVPAMTGGTDATAVDDDVAKALRKHESRAAARADKTVVSPAPEMPAPASPTTPTSSPAGGIGGKAADLGSALEVMRAIGMHVPAVSHIPVIGPILGLWLKARAVMGILGRKGGSIGKSTEGMIAGRAAAVQDRIVAATGALLEGGARAAGKASHLDGPAVLLEGALFPGGEKPKSDSPRDLFEARSDDITRAMQPGAVDQAISQRYPTSDPAMHDAIVAQVQRGIAFLDSKRPKQTVLPGVLPGDGTWKPSAAAIEEFGKFVHAVNDPVSVLEDLAKGHPSAEGAETLRVVYPQLYQYAQKQLLAAAPEMAKTLPYPRRVMLSILYQIPVDGTMQPSHAQYLQIPAPPTPAPKAPATSGPLRLGQQTMSPLDQRAAGA